LEGCQRILGILPFKRVDREQHKDYFMLFGVKTLPTLTAKGNVIDVENMSSKIVGTGGHTVGRSS
jgi:hypothetical protein